MSEWRNTVAFQTVEPHPCIHRDSRLRQVAHSANELSIAFPFENDCFFRRSLRPPFFRRRRLGVLSREVDASLGRMVSFFGNDPGTGEIRFLCSFESSFRVGSSADFPGGVVKLRLRKIHFNESVFDGKSLFIPNRKADGRQGAETLHPHDLKIGWIRFVSVAVLSKAENKKTNWNRGTNAKNKNVLFM